jgi:hypothetical protein
MGQVKKQMFGCFSFTTIDTANLAGQKKNLTGPTFLLQFRGNL